MAAIREVWHVLREVIDAPRKEWYAREITKL